MTQQFDVVVLGGGAAGFMCAIEAGKRGRRVAVIERAERAGKKILISGGGRCNFTNIHCRPENFISANPHFAKSALARYTPADFVALVEKHRIPFTRRPSDNSSAIARLATSRTCSKVNAAMLEFVFL
jgi:predicted flavoprotein YhiN